MGAHTLAATGHHHSSDVEHRLSLLFLDHKVWIKGVKGRPGLSKPPDSSKECTHGLEQPKLLSDMYVHFRNKTTGFPVVRHEVFKTT
jgi:hypothetical protein